MCANRTRPAIGAATFLLLALAGTAFAQAPQVDHLGAHRFRGMEEFQQVIDARCTICHTRERVDIAIKKRRAL
ncbi:MAG: hypothetical protein C0617_06380 [Desulfuromonas sp.]|nr:hypothetical protein [Desulfuromonas sp.]PLX84834.1 MAG: hypothetical protein C0617_06380 [Desulfuromonas sp.]